MALHGFVVHLYSLLRYMPHLDLNLSVSCIDDPVGPTDCWTSPSDVDHRGGHWTTLAT